MHRFSRNIVLCIGLITSHLVSLYGSSVHSYSQQLMDSAFIERIIINQEIIDAFKLIWNEENFPLVYDEYIDEDTIVGEFDYEILKEGIIDYLQNVDTVGDTLGIMDVVRKEMKLYIAEEQLIEEDIEDDLVIVGEKIEIIIEEPKPDVETEKKNDTKPQEKKPETEESPKIERTIIPEFNIENITDNKIVYKVQVAADKNILPIELITDRYNGDMPVFVKQEEGWYRYQIGRLGSYYDASNLKTITKVRDAFVVGYQNNQKINFSSLKTDNPKFYEPSNQHDLYFKVQVAASKKILSKTKITNIYPGDSIIDVVIDNGWYKYQIGNFNEYQSANNIKKTINVPGAFVVAYLDGEKISIKDAISLCCVQKKKTNGNIVFSLQIAADKTPLSNNKLMSIYKGSLEIKISNEDGWYKYTIGGFETYNEAVELKKKTGIRDSFIVAYKNNKRISLSDAFKYSGK